jgi:hypothetical protein
MHRISRMFIIESALARKSGENCWSRTPFCTNSPKKDYGAKFISRLLAKYFGLTIFTSGAKQKFLFTEFISVLDQNARIDSPDFLARSCLIGHSFLILFQIIRKPYPFLNFSLLSRISSNYDWHHSIRWHQFFHI